MRGIARAQRFSAPAGTGSTVDQVASGNQESQQSDKEVTFNGSVRCFFVAPVASVSLAGEKATRLLDPWSAASLGGKKIEDV